MYWKHDRYYKGEQISNNSTWKQELPESGLLSAIMLRLTMTNAAAIQNSNKARIIDHLNKIEVTDGGTKTMFSLTGQELKAQNFYMAGQVMPESAILYGNKTQRTTVLVPFGRHLYDTEYMLDMGAFDSVYLEISNDLSATQCADKGCNVDVQLIMAEDFRGKPAKYMKNYEWRNGKPDADGQHVNHALPTTERLKTLMIQTDPDLAALGSMTHNPASDSYNLKMSLRSGKEIVWDHRPKDIYSDNALQYGRPETAGRYLQSTTQCIDTTIGYVQNTPVGACGDTASTTATAEIVTEESNDRCLKLKNISAGATAPEFVEMLAKGIGYYNTMMLYDALDASEINWLNPAKTADGVGEVKLDWNGYKDDHTFRTCLGVSIPQGQT